MEDAVEPWKQEANGSNGAGGASFRPPEIPPDPMEFLSRSWSVSALQVTKVIAPKLTLPSPKETVIHEDVYGEASEDSSPAAVAGNPFCFASSVTSQLVMERIMSQSEVSPLTSGRLSTHSSGPLNGGGSVTDSPPLSPSELLEESTINMNKYCRASNNLSKPNYGGRNGGRTVGRWLKDRRERKKEEARAHNAQLHAAVSVAGVAAAVAAVAAATAVSSSSSSKDDCATQADMSVASAAALVAAQCVEAAESLGAEREHLAAVVGSAVNVRTPGDIVTLTAAAATALRGAATLKARALKEVWNTAAVIPVEKGSLGAHQGHHDLDHQQQQQQLKSSSSNGESLNKELMPSENFLSLCSQELLARGTELLKRTRKGVLHWKIVSVYINRLGLVVLKMKSRHVAGTITKKKKSVVCEVCKDIPAWPGRHFLDGGEPRKYFGLKTAEHRVIEFECRSQREYEMWTQGVTRLLAIAREKKCLA